MIRFSKNIKDTNRFSNAVFVLVIILSAFTLTAQEAYRFHSNSSPTATGMVKSEYFPINYYTGQANIQVPLYNIESKGMNMPITLSYNSGGVRVNDPNGWVGQNWNLSGGGVITRQINGIPDETFTQRSWFNVVSGLDMPTYFIFDEEHTDSYEDLAQLAFDKSELGESNNQYPSTDMETEPDIFSFKFMKYSGRFFLGTDGEWKVISDSNIKVEFDIMDDENFTAPFNDPDLSRVPNTVISYPKVIAGFTIIDENGNKYTFGYDDEAIEYSINFFRQAYSQNIKYADWVASSWHLTKVMNVNDEVLFDLKYERGYHIANFVGFDQVKYEWKKVFTNAGCTNTTWNEQYSINPSQATGNLVSPVYLSEINSFYNEKIVFDSDDSEQMVYDLNLDNQITPTFAYFQSKFPHIRLYPFNKHAFPGDVTTNPLNGLKWRKLNDINVTRNGNTFRNISFLFNDDPLSRLFLEEVNIKPNLGTQASSSNSLIYKFDYNTTINLPNFLSRKVDHLGFYNGKEYFYNSTSLGEIQEKHYEDREPSINNAKVGSLEKITYPTGGYTNLIYELNDYSYLVSDDRQSILQNEAGNCPGLRIMRMDLFDDPTSNTPTSTKEIFYKKNYSPNSPNGRSSGVLSFKPKYVWNDWMTSSVTFPDGGYKISQFNSNPLIPLGNTFESHIGYDEVTEVFNNGSYIKYKYDSHRTIKDELPYADLQLEFSPYFKYTDKSFLRGKLICRGVHSSSGDPLERETFKYNEAIREQNGSNSYDITSNAYQTFLPAGQCAQYPLYGSARKIYYFKDYVEQKRTEYFRGGYLRKTEDFVNDIIIENANEYRYLSSKTITSGTDSKSIVYTYPKDHSSMNGMVLKHMTNVPISQSVNGGAGGGSKLEYHIGSVIVPKKIYSQRDDGNWKPSQELIYDDFEDTYPDHVKENSKPADFDLFWGSGGNIGLLDLIKYEERIWDNGYNNVRQLTSIIDHNDIESTFDYDGLGRLTLKTSNNGKLKNIYTYQYGLIFNSENIFSDDYSGLDGTGFKTESLFDGLGREETNTKIGYLDGGGNLVLSTTYDNLGRVKTINDPTTGGLSTNTFEESPLSVVEEFKPAGSPKPVKYKNQIEDNNFVLETTDEDGIITKTFTDIFGRTKKTVDGLGYQTIYTYNDRDQVLTINPPGAGGNYNYTYFSDGLLESKTIPDKGTYSYIYDAFDNIDEETLANQKVIKYNFHGLYNDFLMSKTMDGAVLEEYLPYTDYFQDFIGAEKYSIHTDFGVVGQRHEILNTSMDMNFGRPTSQQIITLDGEYTLDLDYDDMGNMLSKTTTVNAFDISRQSKESWNTPKGIRVKATGFVSNTLFGDSQLNYDGHDWLTSKKLADGLQTISYGYNPRGWLSSINGTSSISGFGSNPCAETPDIPIPDLDCDKLSEIIQTFIIKYNCQDLNDGTPTTLEIQINAQTFNNYEQLGVNSESIILPLNGESGNSNSSLDESINFDINNGDDIANIASGIYNVLLDCISQNPDLLSILEQLITESLDNSTTYTENNHSTSNPNQGGIKTNAPFFGMNIYHYSGNEKLLAEARYNGNISWIKWQVFGDIPHAYGFDYDDNNRLLQAIYGEQKEKDNCAIVKTDRYSVPSIGYDELGNIQLLHRRGLLNPEAPQGYEYGFIDKLEYKYEGGSPNLVTSITDDGGEIDKGFVGTSATYSYDDTGNMTSMPNKSLGFLYAFNDLPVRMTTDKGKIINYYTSTGLKLKSVLQPHPGGIGFHPIVTNYFDSQEFINSKLKSIYFGDGRATILKDEEYVEYYLKDHLGNTRVRIADRDGDKKIYYNVNDPENDELMSSHHYYPFGLEWNVPKINKNGNSLESSGVKSKYTYNGKELIDDLDINLHDYGARYYDPAIARWTSVDPLAEAATDWSPFRYGFDNPVRYSDPTSMFEYSNGYGTSDSRSETGSVTHSGVYLNGGDDDSTGSSEVDKDDCCPGDCCPLSGVSVAADAAMQAGYYRDSEGTWYKPNGAVVEDMSGIEYFAKSMSFAWIATPLKALSLWLSGGSKAIQGGQAAKGVGSISKSIHLGKQGKHILGHNNFQVGKSILNSNPKTLLEGFHAGKFKTLRTFDNKAIIDFGSDIGTFYKGGNAVGPTRFGIIHHGKSGAHIVPANPIQF